MKIEINDDSVDQYGRQIQLYVDDEGAEALFRAIDTITINAQLPPTRNFTEGTRPVTTDQEDVTRQ